MVFALGMKERAFILSWTHLNKFRVSALDLILTLLSVGFNMGSSPDAWLTAVKGPFVEVHREMDNYQSMHGRLPKPESSETALVDDDPSSPTWGCMVGMQHAASVLNSGICNHVFDSLAKFQASWVKKTLACYADAAAGADWKTVLLKDLQLDRVKSIVLGEDSCPEPVQTLSTTSADPLLTLSRAYADPFRPSPEPL